MTSVICVSHKLMTKIKEDLQNLTNNNKEIEDNVYEYLKKILKYDETENTYSKDKYDKYNKTYYEKNKEVINKKNAERIRQKRLKDKEEKIKIEDNNDKTI